MFVVNQAPAAARVEAESGTNRAIDLLPPIAATAARTPEPIRDGFELTLRWPSDDRLAELLADAGADRASADETAAIIDSHFGGNVPQDSDLKITLGFAAEGKRQIRSVAVLNDLGTASFENVGGRLRHLPAATSLQGTAVALDGSAYWSLRRHGLSGATADAVLERVGPQGRGGELILVTGRRPDRFNGQQSERLLYFAERRGSASREWIRWEQAPDGWLAVAQDRGSRFDGLMRPTEGRMTSSFGIRLHPLLGFARFHRGIDFAAPWGTPIRAAADGEIAAAGWRGGYGRQVRIDHAGALATTYSHLAQMLVEPGDRVRKGQLVGLAGASGLATGPHLHFEVFRNGRPVDPSPVAGASTDATLDERLAAMLVRVRRARPA